MTGLRMHPRTRTVEKARWELKGTMQRLIADHKLTDAEIQIILNEEARDWLKYELRHERHPDDPDKKADEA